MIRASASSQRGNHRITHLRRALDPDDLDGKWIRERRGTGDQNHLGSPVTRGFGEGKPHLAGRIIADEPDGVDRLVCATGADYYFFSC